MIKIPQPQRGEPIKPGATAPGQIVQSSQPRRGDRMGTTNNTPHGRCAMMPLTRIGRPSGAARVAMTDAWGCRPRLYLVAAPRLNCAIRDALPPKLLSGEIRVAEAERLVEDAG